MEKKIFAGLAATTIATLGVAGLLLRPAAAFAEHHDGEHAAAAEKSCKGDKGCKGSKDEHAKGEKSCNGEKSCKGEKGCKGEGHEAKDAQHSEHHEGH